MGRQIGTATGWDSDGQTDTYYDFRPSFEVAMPIGDVVFDLTEGFVVKYDHAGEEIERGDLLQIVNAAPKS